MDELKKKVTPVIDVEATEAELGIVINVNDITLGDITDLSDETIPFPLRLVILQKMLHEGDARNIRILQLSKVMDLISAKIEKASNPT
jgi:hypothetical protein